MREQSSKSRRITGRLQTIGRVAEKCDTISTSCSTGYSGEMEVEVEYQDTQALKQQALCILSDLSESQFQSFILSVKALQLQGVLPQFEAALCSSCISNVPT